MSHKEMGFVPCEKIGQTTENICHMTCSLLPQFIKITCKSSEMYNFAASSYDSSFLLSIKGMLLDITLTRGHK